MYLCFRLGDGALLQNLYPSHSHVKLRTGKIERIDVYIKRMLKSIHDLEEMTLIKEYEYNQWARTRPLVEKELKEDNSKLYAKDRLESKSVQPSYDTLRSLNPLNSGTKSRIFTYDDLFAKFSQPKFLKKLGYHIEPENPSNDARAAALKHTESCPNITTEQETVAEDEPAGEENLSSDDEEYHQEQEDEEDTTPPETVPCSTRSKRQQLTIYKDDGVLGSAKTRDANTFPKIPSLPELSSLVPVEERPVIPVATVKVDLTTPPVQRLSPRPTVPSEPVANLNPMARYGRRATQKYQLDYHDAQILPTEKKPVKFSQPVCLCPKLSKETLASFYSPSMQKYFSQNTGLMKCRLHSPDRRANREKIILKSL